ncbi:MULTISPECIES: hypothetical protein [Phocaeicola]|jgi:hypothetical protein|uniref:hypothetical protein n=1 Tax=Phocaeicola TaxID=909656 RepID=UPI0011DE0D99|nr:hypothetical protein [Phocaeicola fibrisolvens]MBU3836539.1 hypothetical protein [Candidatus Phocaeicola merdigallinarum]MCU6779460.1 hypothetical protein [Phocaeicola fibrisolvens]
MKNIMLLLVASMTLSSCCTLFSSSKQTITFTGPEGTKIYDASSNMRLGEIGKDQVTTIKIKKKREDKTLIAKKEGYKPSPLMLESTFNNACLWNILFWPGFLIDFGTQKMNKWDNTSINIEFEEKSATE